ncbi:acyltransferase family protein [Rhizobium leguminosarum]|uniref:acyltransferase family protein n=1 Tax=Rhizobium leguminosarum TaxID=384 RepID=UPI001C924BE2|nr:acyltransferase family protein [Rhizobium leguminosarum]MBY2936772.1 acyltransferase [Rhizobium leguminosarum]
MNYRADIDGLRAVAVIGVLMFHFSLGPFPGGFTGVDIFFVISGYLITKLIIEDVEQEKFSFRRFYVRRIRRLFPALLFTLLCSLVTAAFTFPPEEMSRFGMSLAASVFSVSNILFWSEHGYFDVSSHLKPLLHTWSLSVEEQFYLVWPFALVLLLRFGRKAAAVALLIVFVSSLGVNLALEPYQSTLFYLSPFRFFEFAIGASLVFVPPARSNGAMECAFVAGLTMIAYAYRYFSEATLFPSYPALLPTVGAALVIWGGQARWSGRLLRNKAAVSVGLISYSLYLAHWPILVFWQYSGAMRLVWHDRAVLLALTFVIAACMYFFLEQPFRARRSGGYAVLPRSYMLIAASTAATVSAVGLHVWASHGWFWRLGERGDFVKQFVVGDRSPEAEYGGNGCASPCSTSDDRREPDVIFIGDSHSRQYYFGAKEALAGLKVDFYEFSSCQFYSPEYTRDYTGFSDPVLYDRGCRKARASAFQAVENASNALVVIGEYWDPMAMVSEGSGMLMQATTAEGYYRFVGSEISRLQQEFDGRRMIVLGSVPTTGGIGSPLSCYGRVYRLDPGCLSQPIANPVISRRAKTNEILKENLPSSVEFIDPFDALCKHNECSLITDGPIYSDNTHLSGLGAKMVMAAIAPIIRGDAPTSGAQALK